jgi:hypothetical protein
MILKYQWKPMFTAPRDKWIAIKCKHPEDGSYSVVICAYDKEFDCWPTPDCGWLDHEDCVAWDECDQEIVSYVICFWNTSLEARMRGDKPKKDRTFQKYLEYRNSPGRKNISAAIY